MDLNLSLTCCQDFRMKVYVLSVAHSPIADCNGPLPQDTLSLSLFPDPLCEILLLSGPHRCKPWEWMPSHSLLRKPGNMSTFSVSLNFRKRGSGFYFQPYLFVARATLEILIPDFVKQTSEEKPKDSEELEVSVMVLLHWELGSPTCFEWSDLGQSINYAWSSCCVLRM